MLNFASDTFGKPFPKSMYVYNFDVVRVFEGNSIV